MISHEIWNVKVIEKILLTVSLLGQTLMSGE